MAEQIASAEDVAEAVQEMQAWLEEEAVPTRLQDKLKLLWLSIEDNDFADLVAVMDAFIKTHPPSTGMPGSASDGTGSQMHISDAAPRAEHAGQAAAQPQPQPQPQPAPASYSLDDMPTSLDEAEGEILILRDQLAELEQANATLKRNNLELTQDLAHVLSQALDGKNVCEHIDEIPNASLREYVASHMRNRRLGNAIVTPVTPPSADMGVESVDTSPWTGRSYVYNNDDYHERFRFVTGTKRQQDDAA